MIEIRPYAAGDVLDLSVQAAQASEAQGPWRDRLRTRAPAGLAWSFAEGGQLVAIAGIEPEGCDPARAVAWALIGAPSRASWGRMLAFGRDRLAQARVRYRRISAEARADWRGANAALARLGFTLEAPCMAAYGRDGSDYALWAITRGGGNREAGHGR